MLKAETLMARRRARMKAQDDLHAIAERILLNQLKLKSIAQAKQLLKEGKLEMSQIESMAKENAAPAGKMDGDEVVDVENVEEEAKEDLDASLLVEDEAQQFAHQFTAEELRGLDAAGEFVSDLPKETQMALLRKMKAAHRGHVGAISLTSPKRLSGENYSNLQIEQLVSKGGISRRMETVRGEIGSDSFKPIASDPNVRYRLTSPPPTPIKHPFVVDLDNSADSSPQIQRVVMGSTHASSSSSPPPASQSPSLFSSPTSIYQSSHSSTVNSYSTPTKSRPTRKESEQLRYSSSQPHTSSRQTYAQYRLPNASNEGPSLVSAMLDLDPDMALVEMVSDDEEAADEMEANDYADEIDLTDDIIAKETDFGDDIKMEDQPSIEMASSAPVSDPAPKQLGTDSNDGIDMKNEVDIIMVEDDEERNEDDDDLLEIEFEDVGADHEPKTSKLASKENENDYDDPVSSISGEPTSKVVSPPKSPARGNSPAHRSKAAENSNLKTTSSDMAEFGVDTIDVEDEGTFQPGRPNTPQIASPSLTSTVRPSSFLSTSQYTASSSDDTQMLAPRVLNFSSTSSQSINASASKPLDSVREIPFGTDLDISTESQKVPSLNHSLISEEEIQRTVANPFDDLEADLQREVALLEQQAKQGQNQAVVLTSEAVDEAKELLRLFGIPFVQSPSEADAQCAALQMLGLVDGIVSDDSDILVFGGDVVFRHAFSSRYDLELYNIEDIKSELGVDHDGLVFLALLLGGDYAEGLPKVGPRAALDIVSEFPGSDGMLNFKSWLTAFQNGNEDYDRVFAPPSAPFLKRHDKLLRSLKLPESFPNPSVVDAYQNPSIDPSKEAFSWGWPNLAGLRQFALDKFGWTKDRVDDTLLPIIKMYTSALNDPQPKISTFFTNVSLHGYKPKQNKSPKQTASKAKSTGSPAKSNSENASIDVELQEEANEASNRKKRGRAKKAALPPTVEEKDETLDEPSPKRSKTRRRKP